MTSQVFHLPPPVAAFLDPAQRDASKKCGKRGSCCQPLSVLTAFLMSGTADTDADHKMVQLLQAGLVPACMDVIEHHNQKCNAVKIATVWLTTACNIDRVWIMLRTFKQGGFPFIDSSLSNHVGVGNDFFQSMQGTGSTMLVSLATIKILLAAIHFIGRNEGRFARNPEVMAQVTRLIARCLNDATSTILDRELLQLGLNNWSAAAQAATQEQERDKTYVSAKSLGRIIEKPSNQDCRLMQWLLRPDVSNALETWFQGCAWKRDVKVAVKAPSWQRVRSLLVVGYKHSLIMNHDERTKAPLEKETVLAAANLLTRSMEERDGTKSYICSAKGCLGDGEMKCSRCKKANYCSKACQMAHWMQGHKQECKHLAR